MSKRGTHGILFDITAFCCICLSVGGAKAAEISLLEIAVAGTEDSSIDASINFGMTKDGGVSFVDIVRPSDFVDLSISIQPAEDQVSLSADIFVVFVAGDVFYLRNSSGAFIQWNGDLSEFVPFIEGATLSEEYSFNAFSGEIPIDGSFSLYTAFRISGENEIFYNSSAFPFQIASLDTPIEYTSGEGLFGFIWMESVKTGAADSYGHSWYSRLFTLPSQQLATLQMGLGSTIVKPENDDFFTHLCPSGTIAGDLFTGSAAAYYRGAFQTIEGGLGFWGDTKFKSPTPKYRIIGTHYCYSGGFSSPGWGFEDTNLPPEIFQRAKRATAQLSNRLLIPPDGITFDTSTDGEFLGASWMALPLIDARETVFPENSTATPVGSNSWTLFFNTANFKGPIAFVLPDAWADLSSTYTEIESRGFDTRPSDLEGMLMEINNSPGFSQALSDGGSISKIPKLNFPVNEENISIIVQDIRDYSKDALFNSVQSAFSQPASISSPEFDDSAIVETDCGNGDHNLLGHDGVSFQGLDSIVETIVLEENCSLALRWYDNPGEFPQYFMTQGDNVTPISEEEVGFDAAILSEEFQSVVGISSEEFDLLDPNCWDDSLVVAGPFIAELSDRSEVHYSWFRFIDQPSIYCSNLTESEKDELQRRVELIHSNWGIVDSYFAPPSTGELVIVDAGAIVEPPADFAIGYVPIISRQKVAGNLFANFQISDVLGTYHREPVENTHHVGSISTVGGLHWENESGSNWALSAETITDGYLLFLDPNAYDFIDDRNFYLIVELDADGNPIVVGFRLFGEDYLKQ